MLYETLLQGQMFLCLLFFGIVCGIFLTAKKMLDRMLKNKSFVVVTTDIVFMLIFSAIFIFAKTVFCYGEFRAFELIAFLLGVWLQQISINNLVEKVFKMSYNLLGKIFRKLKKTKVFSKIFK